jgi:hypothetical protein
MALIGYAELIRRYGLALPPPWHQSTALDSGQPHSEHDRDVGVWQHFSRTYFRGDTDIHHLVFALRYDGMALGVLKGVFHRMPADSLARAIRSKPTGGFLRRLWFLYEWLLGRTLDVPDLEKIPSYVALYDPHEYVTQPRYRSPRHGVLMNGLGPSSFCPTVRRTKLLAAFAEKRLDERATRVLRGIDADLVARAMAYLVTKETRTSFEIEHESPSRARVQRFLRVLQGLRSQQIGKRLLLDVHDAIVEEEFIEREYRTQQNYVGEEMGPDRQRIHFIPPRPADVHGLMSGLIAGVAAGEGAMEILQADFARVGGGRIGSIVSGEITYDPVVQAAVVGFGFVFIHPFMDGNGRLHRFLVQQLLINRGFTAAGHILPLSAAILRDRAGYDRALEGFSRAIMPFIDHEEAPDGEVSVANDTADLYRYPDLTRQAEFLYAKLEDAIDNDLKRELDYLLTYDGARQRMALVKDLPDRLRDRFITLCVQNGGRLSSRKRGLFAQLDQGVIERLELAVQQSMAVHGAPASRGNDHDAAADASAPFAVDELRERIARAWPLGRQATDWPCLIAALADDDLVIEYASGRWRVRERLRDGEMELDAEHAMQAEGMLRRELVRRVATALPGDPGTLARRLAIAYLHVRQIDQVPMVVDNGTGYAAAVGVLGLEAESAAILASAAGRGSTRA